MERRLSEERNQELQRMAIKNPTKVRIMRISWTEVEKLLPVQVISDSGSERFLQTRNGQGCHEGEGNLK